MSFRRNLPEIRAGTWADSYGTLSTMLVETKKKTNIAATAQIWSSNLSLVNRKDSGTERERRRLVEYKIG
jgi:hypothetical protein